MQAAETGAGFFSAEGGVEKCRGDAAGLERVDLILHEGDQRRDDDGEAVAGEGGELEAKRLAATGGEEGEHVFSDEIGLDDFALEGAERGVAESGF
jgi:hypothetical protein